MKTCFYFLFSLLALLIVEPAEASSASFAASRAGALSGAASPDVVAWVVLIALFGLIGVYPRNRRARPLSSS